MALANNSCRKNSREWKTEVRGASLGPILLRKEPKTLRKSEGAFLPALIDHVGEAAKSGGLRTEGLVWVQFYCKKTEDAPEGRSEL